MRPASENYAKNLFLANAQLALLRVSLIFIRKSSWTIDAFFVKFN
jgi:hypothetical protein